MSDDKFINMLSADQSQFQLQSTSDKAAVFFQDAWVGGCASGVWLESWVEAAETVVVAMGYRIIDLERPGRGLLRVTLNSPSGIGVEDCENVSKQLSRLFEVEQVSYDRLEVSSPGVDRALRRTRDFEESLGLEVQVKLRRALNHRKQYSGVLSRAENLGGYCVLWSQNPGQMPDHELVFTLSELESARLIPHLNFRRVSK